MPISMKQKSVEEMKKGIFAPKDKDEKSESAYKKGGLTKRMNRLEELGRVDSEKASSAKGKKNLTAEKKRIVGELKYAKGGMVGASKMGSVRTAAPSRDGVATKGKTKGKMVVMAGNKRMNKGGRTC